MPNRPATLSIRRRRNPPYFWAKQLIVLIAELDYHLEHNFGHGDKYLSEAFLVLNLLAYFMHQTFEVGGRSVSAGAGWVRGAPGVLGRGPRHVPAIPVPVVGPGAGADELAAAAAVRVAAPWRTEPAP